MVGPDGNVVYNAMMVDDEIEITRTTKMGLEGFGFEVDTFKHTIEALSHYRPHYYSCIILDIQMTGLSGFELARRIWQTDRNELICFFSAFEQYENEALKAFTGKSYCFIKKPISMDTWLGISKTICRRSRSRWGDTGEMIEQGSSLLKPIAISTVMDRLGPSLFGIIRYYRLRNYDIEFDSDGKASCSLEELHSALSGLAGERVATLIIEDIYIELDRLSDLSER